MAKNKTANVTEEAEVKGEAAEEVVEEPKETKAEKAAPKPEDELVEIFVPLVPGEDPEVTVCINGVYTKFRKGEIVKVRKNVAQVLEHSNQMAKVAAKNREKFKNQVREL